MTDSQAGDNKDFSLPVPAVTICGSFRRDPAGIIEVYREFKAAGVPILSPIDPTFVDEQSGFVFAAHELGELPREIEAKHLRAMLAADFVWLHNPDGQVGISAAMELGFAHALGLTVYAASRPEDVVLADFVQVLASPSAALAAGTSRSIAAAAPTRALTVLQEYYRRAAARRGWSAESAELSLALLRKEVDELAKALQATSAGRADGEHTPPLELADITLYVVHLANALGINLAEAVWDKEQINARRFEKE